MCQKLHFGTSSSVNVNNKNNAVKHPQASLPVSWHFRNFEGIPTLFALPFKSRSIAPNKVGKVDYMWRGTKSAGRDLQKIWNLANQRDWFQKNMELCKPAWPNLGKNWHNPIVLTQIRDDNITWERSLPHGWEHFISMKTTVATWQEICSITAHYWEILPHRTSKIVVPMILWTIRYKESVNYV